MDSSIRKGLVSVVLPTFNRAQCVRAAIQSMIAQTYTNFEVLTIDDGSTDDTEDTIRREFGQDPRIRYVKQSNSGVASARNAALALAVGEFIAFLDSDDTWYPWKLELQLACLTRLPTSVGMIWTDMDAVDEQGAVVCHRYLREMYSAYSRYGPGKELFASHMSVKLPLHRSGVDAADFDVGYGDIYPCIVRGNLAHTSSVLLRRVRQQAVGGFDIGLAKSGEDFDFHLRTCREGPVAYIDACSIRYRVGALDQLTHQAYSKIIAANFLRTVEKAIRHDGDRFPLPPSERDEVLAEGSLWLGQELVASGQVSEGRRHLIRSIRLKPFDVHAIICLVRSFIPRPLLGSLRRVRHLAHAIACLIWPS
jgi:glycosyltransferase involved in cell wall biosynthesis